MGAKKDGDDDDTTAGEPDMVRTCGNGRFAVLPIGGAPPPLPLTPRPLLLLPPAFFPFTVLDASKV